MPTKAEINACEFVSFDRESYIKGEIEDGMTLAEAIRAADRAERRHEEDEGIRTALAKEKVKNIMTNGRRYAQRFWR